MPTIFSHAAAAVAMGQLQTGPLPRGFWLVTAFCAVLPDADVIAFGLGIPYGHLFGHRGLSHSLAFAAVAGALCAWAFGRGGHAGQRIRFFVHFTVVTVSHGLLDGLTDGGRGVAFFAPFDSSRYFLPWRPIAVSPIGGGFFTARSNTGDLRWLGVFASELVWVWLPFLALGLACRARRTRI
jgi:inner membrane protein